MLANSKRINNEFTRLPLCNIKYLPQEFASPMVIWIFGDYVASVLWQDPETITLIKDEKMAKSYLDYYKALERLSKQ